MKPLRALPLLFLWLGHAGNSRLWVADPLASPDLKKACIHAIVSGSKFGSVNEGDATASMNIRMKQIGKIRGFDIDQKIEITRFLGQLRKILIEHTADLPYLDTPEYLPLAEAKLIGEVFARTSRGQLGAFRYMPPTKDASGVTQLAGLRGKRIAVASRAKSNMGLVWLETPLAENKLGRVAGIFGAVDIGNRASSYVLTLFFNKVDAWIVDSGNWETNKELNPQLSRLRVVATSEARLEGLIAMPVQPHPYQRELIESILDLHKSAAGEQFGIVFRTGPLVRAAREQFESVRALRARYHRMVDPSWDGLGLAAGRSEEVAGKERS